MSKVCNGIHKRGDKESNILAYRSASVCQLEIEIERELESHDTERDKDDELHREPGYTCSLSVACTSCSTRKVGTSCINTAKVSCHGGKIASKKFRR